jgi:hypothetical protein
MIERYTNCPRIRKRRLGGRLRPEGLATLTAPQGAAFEVSPPRHSRAAAQLTLTGPAEQSGLAFRDDILLPFEALPRDARRSRPRSGCVTRRTLADDGNVIGWIEQHHCRLGRQHQTVNTILRERRPAGILHPFAR